MVSGIHWGSWNMSPLDKGELLYLRPVITVKIIRITIYMYLRRYGEWVRVK